MRIVIVVKNVNVQHLMTIGGHIPNRTHIENRGYRNYSPSNEFLFQRARIIHFQRIYEANTNTALWNLLENFLRVFLSRLQHNVIY
jgi:hypothetical protein